MVTRAQAKLIRRLRRRKRREEEELFLVEGVRLVEELLQSDHAVELFVTAPALTETERGRRLLRAIHQSGRVHSEVSDDELERLADTASPQAVVAVARKRRSRLAEFDPRDRAAVVVFDRLADPGNLGTLLRTAHALGADWAVALPGTVDPWNPKAARASAGALFRLPVSQEPWPDALAWLRDRGFTILCADPDGEPVPRGYVVDSRFALVLGNEASGPSPEVRRDCDRVVAVALPGGLESLNVAIAGALMLDRLLGDRAGSGEGEAS